MNEREATQRLMRARTRVLAFDKETSAEDLIEAADELAAASAALNRPPLVVRLSVLTGVIEDLDRLVVGDEFFPPAVWPEAIRDKVVTASRLLHEARTAIVESE